MRCNATSELMGHKRSIAPQQAAPLFDLQTSDVARSHASSGDRVGPRGGTRNSLLR
jgi:hypothetical protein